MCRPSESDPVEAVEAADAVDAADAADAADPNVPGPAAGEKADAPQVTCHVEDGGPLGVLSRRSVWF